MSSGRLYGREELLSLYQQALKANKKKIIDILRPSPLIIFRKLGVISQDQLTGQYQASERFDHLISYVLERNDLEIYIKFSRGLQYVNKVEVKSIFEFVPDIFSVGLHDPLIRNRDTQLSKRLPGSEHVVLWIVAENELYCSINKCELTSGEPQDIEGYLCQKSRPENLFDMYVVYPNKTSKTPGRKFDGLLTKFNPCPTLVVYSGICQPVSGASVSSPAPGTSVIISSSENSEFDLSAEGSHVSELLKLRGHLQGERFFPNIVGRATRYSYEEGTIVHCPDALSVHRAASGCQLPALVLAKFNLDGSSVQSIPDEDFIRYVFSVIKELL